MFKAEYAVDQSSRTFAEAMLELRQRPRQQWIEFARAHQSECWRQGTVPTAERYFAELPEVWESPEDAIVLICGEALLRRELGDSPRLEEYRQRFPRYADSIALQFEVNAIFAGEESDSEECDTPELPGYEFLEHLGSGASGSVYKARQTSLKRLVAIKVFDNSFANETRSARPSREAELLARITHPHVVQIHEVARHERRLCLVMEYVDGRTLVDALADGPLSPTAAARAVATLARAIHAVHEAGVLHRDLKPANILIAGDGRLLVSDFGLAKLRANDSQLTTENAVLGTPSYMAPEQAVGDVAQVGVAADVYSLGAILYELLTGRPPFLGATILETLALIRHHEPAPPRRLQPQTPRDLETICLKCLSKAPQQRYVRATELAEDLERFLAGEPIHARPAREWERVWRWSRRNPLVSVLASGLVLALLTGFAGVLWQWRVAETARQAESDARQEADRQILQLQDAVSLVERAKHFRDVERFIEVRKCLDEAVRLRPEYRTAWEERGHLHASMGLWDLALTDWRQAMKLDVPPLAVHWWEYAVLMAFADDHQGLAEWSARMREHFRGHLGPNRLNMVRTSCLMNLPGTDYHQLVKLAQLESTSDTNDAQGDYVLGLAYYRAGRYEESLKSCQKSIGPESGANPWCYALNYAVQALAYTRQGRSTSADGAVVQAKHWEELWTKTLYDSGSSRWRFGRGATTAWPLSPADWLEFQTLMREVSRARNETPPAPDFRWIAIRARSFAALGRHDDAAREYQDALALSPDNTQLKLELHRSVALCAVKRPDYAMAAEEFGKAQQLDPDDALLCQYQAQAQLYAGNMAAYRQTCQEMIDQFKATENPETAARVVHTWMMQADSRSNVSDLLRLSAVASKAWPGGEWLQAVTCVRAGHYAEALRLFQLADLRQVPRPRDMLFKAIAFQELGQLEQSEHCLDEARDWIRRADEERLPTIDMTIPSWDPWYERSESMKLLEEVESLQSKSSP